MDLAEIADEMARLDAIFAPVAKAPVDTSDPDWTEKMAARFNATPTPQEALMRGRAELVLHAIVNQYATGDDATRAAIRAMFNRYTSFRWAAHLPRHWDTTEDFRAHLIHLSARDQDTDTRDEILTLRWLCSQARDAGIDVGPILIEVAAMSSDVDRYGMGSTKQMILEYGH